MISKSKILPDEEIISAVQNWIEKAVIGLNLCPFAKSVYLKNQIRYVVSSAVTPASLLSDLECELHTLAATDSTILDTTLLIHPYLLTDFLDYNDFLSDADNTLTQLGFSGEIQIASFHPHYQFADTTPDEISNFTNRSPYPILHLLREASIDRAVAAFPNAERIFEQNMKTLKKLGHEGWQHLWQESHPNKK